MVYQSFNSRHRWQSGRSEERRVGKEWKLGLPIPSIGYYHTLPMAPVTNEPCHPGPLYLLQSSASQSRNGEPLRHRYSLRGISTHVSNQDPSATATTNEPMHQKPVALVVPSVPDLGQQIQYCSEGSAVSLPYQTPKRIISQDLLPVESRRQWDDILKVVKGEKKISTKNALLSKAVIQK